MNFIPKVPYLNNSWDKFLSFFLHNFHKKLNCNSCTQKDFLPLFQRYIFDIFAYCFPPCFYNNNLCNLIKYIHYFNFDQKTAFKTINSFNNMQIRL